MLNLVDEAILQAIEISSLEDRRVYVYLAEGGFPVLHLSNQDRAGVCVFITVPDLCNVPDFNWPKIREKLGA